ncbi:MAG: Rne/Rng family ribonuclease [Bdellovibrionales bacterium]|nr:Rne/Rng family ribonuclease [Bdellovibrionales bacterium]MCB0377658.1 Rne/Rng family ribonuclease [Bdellovibrionales bacterium]
MVTNQILINVNSFETRVACLEKGNLVDFKIERKHSPTLVGTIHKGKVIRVLPGMQAAFVDIGLERAAFLYVGDVREEGDSINKRVEAAERSEDEQLPDIVAPEDKPKIQELLREGQSILVQVAKDPVGTKGARITTHVSLAGRKIVYLPTLTHIGISRKIEDENERERLRLLLESKPTPGGAIVRTAGEGMNDEELAEDLGYLAQIWNEIQKTYAEEKGIGLIYSEVDFELRILRDFLSPNVQQVIIDQKDSFIQAQEFVNQYMPQFRDVLELYEEEEPLFDKFGVSLDVAKAIDRKVWLRSGGYLVIDETEALVVIDVNTGRFIGKKDLEETIFKTNMEAVKEIAHQIRVRDCGGIIIVDFIDMMVIEHREKILEALTEEVKSDSVRVSVISMTGLGLVELTRKRMRPSLLRSLTEPCFYCEGLGRLKKRETLIADIFRDLRRHILRQKKGHTWVVSCHTDLVNWVYSEESELISQLEGDLGVSIIFKADPSLHWEEFKFDVAS